MIKEIKKDIEQEKNDTSMNIEEVKKLTGEDKIETKEETKGEDKINSENSSEKINDIKLKGDFSPDKGFRKNFVDKNKFRKNFRKKPMFKREKPEFEQKILSLRRVTRVMAGGRRFSFSVAMVVGDKKNRVGLGMGKSNDTTLAIEKAIRNAKKNMVKIKLTEEGSVFYDVSGKYKSSEVVIRPIHGKGLAAGGAVRAILEFVGAKEAGAKILSRSKNHINNAKATLVALEPFSEKVEVSLQTFDKNKRNFKPRRFGQRQKFVNRVDNVIVKSEEKKANEIKSEEIKK